ncbi:enolase-phosphatase E1-like isoform X2 [Antennarius striatus]|uniref:enolase-phosphatase E1-like isoform X2 n=1 Tax=Antennarius striatus TaxID=241820 RepID=UPI0035AE2F4F
MELWRAKEMSSDELPFLCHGENDHAKILWNDGEAVGFYSVKPSGSLCNAYSNRSYQLPVMDSIFVRKRHRGNGFGLQMLEDFVLTYKDHCLGLKYPLSKSMYKVCEKYLCQYPGDEDLLWEVESVGGPKQRTRISCKIKTMSVSRSLTFTEDSFMVTEVSEKEMEDIPTQIKETVSMDCTVEIMEEVTILRTTQEDELPISDRCSKQIQNMEDKITEGKSEKVIRIEDIEAETPREEQIPAQHKKENNLPTVYLTSVMTSDKPATVLGSQDLDGADVTSVSTMEDPQVVDVTQIVNNSPCESQITVENVASEIEEPEEDFQREETTVELVSEEVLEVHKGGEPMSKLGERTQIEVSEENLEEIVKRDFSEVNNGKSIEDETPRGSRLQEITKEDELIEETTAQEGMRILRRKCVLIKHTPKKKYTLQSQKVNQESEKECEEVSEETKVFTANVEEKLMATERKEPEEVISTKEVVSVEELKEKEQLANEEETEEREDLVMKDGSTEIPDIAEDGHTKKNVDVIEEHQEGKEMDTSEIQDEQDDEIEEPPVVQRRSLRNKQNVTSKRILNKETKERQKQDEKRAGGEEKPADKVTDEPMGEEELNAGEENTIPEDVVPSNEGNMEECKEVQEDKEIEMASEMVEKVQETKDGLQELDIVSTTSEIVVVDVENGSEFVVGNKTQETDAVCEIPKLLKAAVILVDLKTPGMTEQEVPDGVTEATKMPENDVETSESHEADTVKKEELEEDESNEEKEEPSAAETLLVETDVLKSDNTAVNVNEAETDPVELEEEMESMKNNAVTVPVEETQSAVVDAEDNRIPAPVDEEISFEEEEAPVITRALRSGTKTVVATPKHKTRSIKHVDKQEAEMSEEEPASRSNEQLLEEQEGTEEKTSVEERGEDEEAIKKTAGTHADLQKVGPKDSVEEEVTGLGSAVQPPTEGDEEKTLEEDETEAENEELKTVEEDKGVSDTGSITMTEEENTEEGAAPQPSHFQRVTVLLVDLKTCTHEVQNGMATMDRSVPVENTAPEGEEGEMKEEEQTAKGGLSGSDVDDPEKLAKEEGGRSDPEVEDADTREDTGDGGPEGAAKEGEAQDPPTSESKPTEMSEQDEEVAAGKSTEKVRVLRKRKRPAPAATPRSKYKRACTLHHREEEEENTPSEAQAEESEAPENNEENNDEPERQKEKTVEEESTPVEVEEAKADDEEQNGDDVMIDNDVKEPVDKEDEIAEPRVEENVESQDEVGEEEETEQVGTVVEKSSDSEEMVQTRVLRKRPKSAAATPTWKSKRVRTKAREEEETHVTETKAQDTENIDDEEMEGSDEEETVGQTEPAGMGETSPTEDDAEPKEADSAERGEQSEENHVEAVDSTSEKRKDLNLLSDEDEDAETPSDEETEPVMMERILRGRTVTVTPSSHTTRRVSKVQMFKEESSSDEEESIQRRVYQKRKSTRVTPRRQSQRLSRVYKDKHIY